MGTARHRTDLGKSQFRHQRDAPGANRQPKRPGKICNVSRNANLRNRTMQRTKNSVEVETKPKNTLAEQLCLFAHYLSFQPNFILNFRQSLSRPIGGAKIVW